jgi:hypothetical protein
MSNIGAWVCVGVGACDTCAEEYGRLFSPVYLTESGAAVRPVVPPRCCARCRDRSSRVVGAA